jgi:hypothetical protein
LVGGRLDALQAGLKRNLAVEEVSFVAGSTNEALPGRLGGEDPPAPTIT